MLVENWNKYQLIYNNQLPNDIQLTIVDIEWGEKIVSGKHRVYSKIK